MQKIQLSSREDFNLIDAFSCIDLDGKGNINPQELLFALSRRLEVPATEEDCCMFFLRFNKDGDGLFKYNEFTSAFMPVNQHFARKLGAKRLNHIDAPSQGSSFSYETF